MTVSLFITLLTLFSTVTSLMTEGVKIALGDRKINFSSNLLVLIISVIVGIGGTAVFYYAVGIPFIGINLVAMLLMAPANALGAMVGYDKVIQTIEQINTING